MRFKVGMTLCAAALACISYNLIMETQSLHARLQDSEAQRHSATAALSYALYDTRMELADLKERRVSLTKYVASDVHTFDVPLAEGLQLYLYDRCEELGIPEYYSLLVAMIWQESNFNPNLISHTNDYGLMQINVSNHGWLSQQLGITNLLDPKQNIDAGTHIFSALIHKYGDVHKALMAYNYGEAGAQRRWAAGTYTSVYSREVVRKEGMLQ